VEFSSKYDHGKKLYRIVTKVDDEKTRACPKCSGKGEKNGNWTCKNCSGTGKMTGANTFACEEVTINRLYGAAFAPNDIKFNYALSDGKHVEESEIGKFPLFLTKAAADKHISGIGKKPKKAKAKKTSKAKKT